MIQNLNWAFGFNKDKVSGIHSLCSNNRNAFLTMSSHSAVVYDYENRSQTILQGHCNKISCCVVDKSKRWIITADVGYDPIMIVWDAVSCLPVKTYNSPHEAGVSAVDISDDAVYIVTLSAADPTTGPEQQIAIWAWTVEESDAVLRQSIDSTESHTCVKFNPQNKSQIISSGPKTVCFWHWDEFNLDSYIGKVSKTDLGNFTGNFVSSLFLPGTVNALSATSDGYIVLWEGQQDSSSETSQLMKSATKVLRLVDSGINLMTTTTNDYLVIGCADGAVRFYDFYLRLEAWFEDLAAGGVSSVTFADTVCPFSAGEAGAPGLRFWVPDFIVGTVDAFVIGVESALFDEVKREDRRGILLLQGMASSISSVACHPGLPLIAILCNNGTLQLWNYELKLLMCIREFPNDPENKNAPKVSVRANCMTFDSTGSFLAVGFSSGIVKILDSNTMGDLISFAPTSDSVVGLKFSKTGNFLAGYDSHHHLLLFSRETADVNLHQLANENAEIKLFAKAKEERVLLYTFVGRAKSHTSAIVGIEFGVRDSVETLISVSEDRYCVEYDLTSSTVLNGVQCVKEMRVDGSTVGSHRLELSAKPTAVMWHPPLDDDVEDRFIVANDEFKLKEYNLDSKQCRRTTLAPRFGSPPVTLLPIRSNPDSGEIRHFVFSTSSRVIGVGEFPLTGSPSKMMGIVAHPGEISSLAVSFDGKYVFSAGGEDLTVNMWNMEFTQNAEEKEVYVSLPGEEDMVIRNATELKKTDTSLKPFFNLLEGGENGELHCEIVDYFYYCQLRNWGEDSMEQRDLPGLIPLEEIPSLVRAIGYYPSEEEVANMINEVRYKRFMITGETQDMIGLEELIKLYLNHRPVLSLDKQYIVAAFEKISESFINNPIVNWSKLRECLTSHGEKISLEDLNSYLVALTGGDSASLPDDKIFDSRNFSQQFLGFEDFSMGKQ